MDLKLSEIRERVAVDAIRLAPKSAFSGVVGWSARRKLPRALRVPVYQAFANVVGAELGEVEHALGEYQSFGDFFSRGLKLGARSLPVLAGQWAAPCDCRVAEIGELSERVIEAKGQSFSLTSLLGSERLALGLRFGDFLTLYLSPKDYHRVHAPIDCRLIGYQYIPGNLFPVSPFFRKRIDNIFARNERLVLELESECGVFALVMVGAAGVGNLRLCNPPLESRYLRRSSRRSSGPQIVHLEQPIEIAKGQELGAFELGSTVILCMPPGTVDLRTCVGEGLQFGDVIAAIAAPKKSDELS